MTHSLPRQCVQCEETAPLLGQSLGCRNRIRITVMIPGPCILKEVCKVGDFNDRLHNDSFICSPFTALRHQYTIHESTSYLRLGSLV